MTAEWISLSTALGVWSDISLVTTFVYEFRNNFQLSHKMPLQRYKEKDCIYREEFNFHGNFKTPLPTLSLVIHTHHVQAYKSSARKWNTWIPQQWHKDIKMVLQGCSRDAPLLLGNTDYLLLGAVYKIELSIFSCRGIYQSQIH